ncbi:MAG: hypothetical protein HN837_04660 [Chloroflexi bacterium]|nr:hypothetical protein [Chloroflexota bacterium]MBT7289769.1 hypothetical protein [Chloroflexota bacterium]
MRVGSAVVHAPVRLWRAIAGVLSRLAGRLQRRAFVAKLQKGDIILANPRTLQLSAVNMLYRLFLRAKYVHSMLYIGDGNIIHTTSKKGVQIAPLPRKIHKSGHYKIVRARDLSDDQRELVVQQALKMQGQQIDPAGLITNIPARMLGFKKPLIRLERNRLWCAKLIYKAYLAAGIDLVGPDHAGNVTTEDLSNSSLLKSISK